MTWYGIIYTTSTGEKWAMPSLTWYWTCPSIEVADRDAVSERQIRGPGFVSGYEVVPIDQMEDRMLEYVLTDQLTSWAWAPKKPVHEA